MLVFIFEQCKILVDRKVKIAIRGWIPRKMYVINLDYKTEKCDSRITSEYSSSRMILASAESCQAVYCTVPHQLNANQQDRLIAICVSLLATAQKWILFDIDCKRRWEVVYAPERKAFCWSSESPASTSRLKLYLKKVLFSR